jgi:16S rRNA (guanine527-N7)-methyltransferase
VARLHVLDSLAALPVLRARGATRLLDIGSGGGFPGFPLAVALGTERALLVDSVGKKVRFLQAVVEATGHQRRIAAEVARSEALARDPRDRGMWPVVTARAVTSLAELVELALPLVAPGGALVAWKREPLDDELAAAGGALQALRAGPVAVHTVRVPGLAGHRLVVVPRDGPVDARFPRDPAERKRHPL